MTFGAAIDPRNPRNMLFASAVQSADAEPSRREKAFQAIEGHENGFLERNPWVPILDFDESIVNAVEAFGGLVVTLQLNDPVSFSDTDRLAVLWDDDTLADGPKTVRQGSRVVVTIPSVKGTRLSVWCTSLLSATVVDTQPLAKKAEVEAREATANKAAADADAAKPNPVSSFLDKYLTASEHVGLLAVVVGGAVLYFYLKKG